ncbi:MAG: hypothetical protein HONBIEJF_01855 [Fimbriimonadaceae bacterium]|nr:hypothetical protein [Fimbriimonadaceae bacterium]
MVTQIQATRPPEHDMRVGIWGCFRLDRSRQYSECMVIQMSLYLFALVSIPVASSAEFIGVGQLVGGESSSCFAISFDGGFCGGQATPGASILVPVIWSSGLGIVALIQGEPFDIGQCNGITSNGSAVGYFNNDAFYYTDMGFMLIPDGEFNARFAYDLSSDAQIVVGRGGTGAGWTWRPGELPQKIVPPATWQIGGSAEGISSDGSVIVGYGRNPQNKTEAYRLFSDFPFEPLGAPPAADPYSETEDCNADGSVVVGNAGGKQAFRWTESAGMQSIGFNLYCHAVSGDGEVMVGMELDFDLGEFVAVVWINGVKHDLRQYLIDNGAPNVFPYLEAAYDVSADGTMICGAGKNDQGIGEGFWCRIPRTLGPHSIRVNIQKPVFGSITAGDRRSTFTSDDQRLEITNGVVPSNSLSPVTWEIEGTAARLAPSKLEFKLEAQVSRSGLSQTIDLWNHQTQSWQTVDTRAATMTDQTVTIERTTDATQFVRPQDGKVKARIRYKATAPGASSTWKARIDHARWTAHP